MLTASRPLSGDQSRPMTGVRGAGFTSRTDAIGVSANTNPLLQGFLLSRQFVFHTNSSLPALSAETLFKESNSPDEKAQELERQIHDLVERSTVASLTNKTEATKLATEALKLVFTLSIYDCIPPSLPFLIRKHNYDPSVTRTILTIHLQILLIFLFYST